MTDLVDTHGNWTQVDESGLRELVRAVGRRRAGRSTTGSGMADRVAERLEKQVMQQVATMVDAGDTRQTMDSRRYNVRIRKAADGKTVIDVHGAGDETGREVRDAYNLIRGNGLPDGRTREQLVQLRGFDPGEVDKAVGIDHYLRVELHHMHENGSPVRSRMHELGLADNPSAAEEVTA